MSLSFLRNRLLIVVLLLSCAPAGHALETWYELTTDNFTLITNDSRKTAHALLVDLERFRYFLGQITDVDVDQAPAPLRIFAFRSRQNYQYAFPNRGTSGVYFSKPGGATFLFSTQESSYDVLEDGREVLFHEYVHHFLKQYSPLRYPTWYSEGFADYLATFEYEDDVITIGKPMIGRVAFLDKRKWLDFKDMMATNLGYIEGWEHGRSNLIMLYAQGWFFTHYLQTHSDYLPKLQDYIIRLNKGEAYEEAFQAAFEMSLDEMEGELEKYWETMQMPYIQYRVNTEIEMDIKVRKMPRAEGKYQYAEAVLATRWADQRSNIVRKKIEQALRLDADDNHAYLLQGEIELEEEEFDEARKMYERVLSREPENARALMLKAGVLFRQARLDDVPEEQQRVLLTEVQEIVRGIIKKNPKHSGAHFGLLKTNLVEAMPFNEEEAFASHQAFRALVPGMSMVTLTKDMYIRAGDYQAAKDELMRYRIWSEDEEFLEEIDSEIERIDALAAGEEIGSKTDDVSGLAASVE